MEDILIEKLAFGKQITDDEIASALNEICVRIHPDCDTLCPVFRMNGNRVVFGTGRYARYGCECFSDGRKMLAFLRKKQLP